MAECREENFVNVCLWRTEPILRRTLAEAKRTQSSTLPCREFGTTRTFGLRARKRHTRAASNSLSWKRAKNAYTLTFDGVVPRERRRAAQCTVWSVVLVAACARDGRANDDGAQPVCTTVTDPQTGVAQDSLVTRAAMCVRLVDVRITCGLHDDAQLAAVFIDPRAK